MMDVTGLTPEQRQTLDVHSMQRYLLELAEKLREISGKSNELLLQKANVDGELAMLKNQTVYIKAQMSAVQSALKSATQL